MDARANRFLDSFTPSGRERLLACLVQKNYPEGTYLFREGDVADGIYLVLDGQVEIVRAAGNNEKILDCILTGDYLGEVAVLDGFGRSTSARARGNSVIAKIPRAPLLEVLSGEPGALTLGLFQQVLTHLRKANDLVVLEVVHKEKLSLVGEMASSLMHDLRNPVAGIRLSADLINLASKEGKVAQWCNGIRLQCDRVVAMAEELLEFSRGESKLHLNRITTTAFLDQFKALNDGYLRQTGVKVSFDTGVAEIEIDSMRLLRVVQNLVTNAVEALSSTPDPHIQIRAWIDGSFFYLAVKDNGPGIPDAIKNQIFEPFVTHGKRGGTGLGMAIARNIVAAHGGTITFESAPNRGTSFLIQIPQTAL